MLLFAGVPGLALAQVLGGTGGSHSFAQVTDSAGYTPMVGGAVTVENYFGSSNGVPNASALANHAFSNILIPGAGGLTSGAESASVIDSLSNGSASAVYMAQLVARGAIASSVTGAGSNREVDSSIAATGDDEFDFTLGAATELSLAGQATLLGVDPCRVQLVLTDVTTNQVLFVGGPGLLATNLLLDSGNYTLSALASIGAGFDFNAFQGQLLNSPGPFEADLNYTATFTPPSPAPEPGTIALGVACVWTTLWARRTKQARPRS